VFFLDAEKTSASSFSKKEKKRKEKVTITQSKEVEDPSFFVLSENEQLTNFFHRL
jgi:hypothetical protein